MSKALVTVKSIVWAVGFSIFVLAILLVGYFFNSKTKVVFCNVGQGDATYIRTADRVDILVDSGPNRQVLTCLGRHMPFYDRKIEAVFLTHSQKDHYGGLLHLLKRYRVDYLIVVPVANANESFALLREELEEADIKLKSLYAGQKALLKGVQIKFFWPEKEFLVRNGNPEQSKTEGGGSVLGWYSSRVDLNSFSQIFVFSIDSFDILFTGDAPSDILGEISPFFSKNSSEEIEILKVPHHGSKNGLTRDFLTLADPDLSVISVGKKNSYGHPAKEVLDLFETLNKNYLRTDIEGDIVVKIEKGKWMVEED